MKIWVDDVRSAPEGYVWCKSVNEVIETITLCEKLSHSRYETAVMMKSKNLNDMHEKYIGLADDLKIELLDIDHDSGDYVWQGGDYIKLLDWLEETGRNYPIHIHSMNPVGVENMRKIIKRNGWKEV